MDQIQQYLGTHDFTSFHGFLTFYGALAAVFVMQLTSYEREDAADPPFMRWGNRLWHTLLALAMLWSFSVTQASAFSPWRPGMLVLVALDLLLTHRIVTIYIAIRRRNQTLADVFWHHHPREENHVDSLSVGRRHNPRGLPRSWGQH